MVEGPSAGIHPVKRRKRNGITPREREDVMLNSAYCCVYCGHPATEVDHIVPFSRGGGCDIENYAAACRECNSEKRDLTPDEWAELRISEGKPWPIPSFDARLKILTSRFSLAEVEKAIESADKFQIFGGYEKFRGEIVAMREVAC